MSWNDIYVARLGNGLLTVPKWKGRNQAENKRRDFIVIKIDVPYMRRTMFNGNVSSKNRFRLAV
jgi:hypothetical protein